MLRDQWEQEKEALLGGLDSLIAKKKAEIEMITRQLIDAEESLEDMIERRDATERKSFQEELADHRFDQAKAIRKGEI